MAILHYEEFCTFRLLLVTVILLSCRRHRWLKTYYSNILFHCDVLNKHHWEAGVHGVGACGAWNELSTHLQLWWLQAETLHSRPDRWKTPVDTCQNNDSCYSEETLDLMDLSSYSNVSQMHTQWIQTPFPHRNADRHTRHLVVQWTISCHGDSCTAPLFWLFPEPILTPKPWCVTLHESCCQLCIKGRMWINTRLPPWWTSSLPNNKW